MKAGGFWTPGVTAFFDVRVTHVNSRSNQGKYTATIFKEQENEKKRKYNQRVMDVDVLFLWMFYRSFVCSFYKILIKNFSPYLPSVYFFYSLP